MNAVGYGLTALGGVLLYLLGAPPPALIVGGSVLALGGFFVGWGCEGERMSNDEVKRIRRMVDYLGGPDGGFTYGHYLARYGSRIDDAASDFSKQDVRRALTEYADLLEELEQQRMERDLRT